MQPSALPSPASRCCNLSALHRAPQDSHEPKPTSLKAEISWGSEHYTQHPENRQQFNHVKIHDKTCLSSDCLCVHRVSLACGLLVEQQQGERHFRRVLSSSVLFFDAATGALPFLS